MAKVQWLVMLSKDETVVMTKWVYYGNARRVLINGESSMLTQFKVCLEK